MKHLSFRRLTIAQQLLLMSTGMLLIIIIGITLYMVSSSVNATNEQLKIMASGRAAGVIEKIDRNFYERFGDVQAFAFNKVAREAIAQDSANFETREFMNTMVSYYVLYDLMVICNARGKVICTNTKDKGGNLLQVKSLLGKDFSNEEWFRASMSGAGPEGGAWFSDFTKNDDVTRIYGRDGWGMAFAAPIRNEVGEAVGVWYNFASWQEVTGGIRKETEAALKQSQPGAFILITNANHEVIDADDEKMLLQTHAAEEDFNAGASFDYEGKLVSKEIFVTGSKEGTGAYTFKGKGWYGITFIPKAEFNLAYIRDNLLGFLIGMAMVTVLASTIIYRVSATTSKDINTLKNTIEKLAHGELVEVVQPRSENEIGEMTSAIAKLVNGMKETAKFAQQIGSGNLNSDFTPLSEKDVLGQSLLSMRNSLSHFEKEDQKRQWTNEGYAKFGELLRINQMNVAVLADQLITSLVKYLKANQGMFYVINSDSDSGTHLELIAAYAWDRKKYLEKKIQKGEGLTGQCWQEEEVIYMTDIPKEFVRITSGIGEALPRSVAIIPLKSNAEVFGVLELASFEMIETYQLDFLSKLAESIAATIASVRINEKTRILLEQAQHQAEELKAQEEEMRQNMEELSATQEEMARKEQEYLRKIERLESA